MFDQQLTFDGRSEDIAPITKQDRLFTAPTTMKGQTSMTTAATYPMGSTVTTTVHGVGGRSSKVSGKVVGHKRGQLIVTTECHGRLMVPLNKID